jgi:hypothetical protein
MVESLGYRPGDQVTVQFGAVLDHAFLFCREAMKRPIPNIPRGETDEGYPGKLGFLVRCPRGDKV